MSLELKQHLKMSQQLVMTPQLQQAIKLLQLSRMELAELVRDELEQNPLLEDNEGLEPEIEEKALGEASLEGYASPIGLNKDLGRGRKLIVVADDSAVNFPNLVGGANKLEYHLKNTNAQRDYEPDIVADIALAQDGDKCVDSDAVLKLHRGIEVGHCFKLGKRYSEAMNVTFLNENGQAQN